MLAWLLEKCHGVATVRKLLTHWSCGDDHVSDASLNLA